MCCTAVFGCSLLRGTTCISGRRSDREDRKEQGDDTGNASVAIGDDHLIVSGVPMGMSAPRRSMSALVNRIHPWDTAPGMRLGWLVP